MYFSLFTYLLPYLVYVQQGNSISHFCGQLLVVDENGRLGTTGADAVKKHPWFDGIDWKQTANGTSAVPQEISDRIDSYVETLQEDLTVPSSMPGEDPADLTAPEWIQDW
jgi:protein kinase X